MSSRTLLNLLYTLFACSALINTSWAQATPPLNTDVDTLRSLAQNMVVQQVEQHFPGDTVEVTIDDPPNVVIGKVCGDPTLDIPSLTRPGHAPQALLSVRVKCPAPTAWAFYLRARITLTTDVVTTVRNIPRGTVLRAADLTIARRTRTGLPRQFVHAIEDVVGLTTRRNLSAQQALSANQLAVPMAVKRGEEVAIRAQRGTVTITTTGVAQSDAQIGRQVRVKNQHSNRIIKAWVWDKGLVGTTPRQSSGAH